MKKRRILFLLFLAAGNSFLFSDPARLKLSTTTSTENSGLLAVLIPPFEDKTGLKVDIIAVGTGKALILGKNGDVDVVLVHARAAEDEFVASGFGVNRRNVMHNDFIIIGPQSDPAGVSESASAAEALRKIAESCSFFISRGDDSGTDKKEKALWNINHYKASGPWYKEAGQGMGAVITMANNMNAYTLTDRATFLSMQDSIDLKILVEGDPVLVNPYGVIAVNPEKHKWINYTGAIKFINWITSVEGQQIIGNYKKKGQVLFYPDVIK